MLEIFAFSNQLLNNLTFINGSVNRLVPLQGTMKTMASLMEGTVLPFPQFLTLPEITQHVCISGILQLANTAFQFWWFAEANETYQSRRKVSFLDGELIYTKLSKLDVPFCLLPFLKPESGLYRIRNVKRAGDIPENILFRFFGYHLNQKLLFYS